MVGAEPSFTEVDVLRTLFQIAEGRKSRKNLMDSLGLGEGSMRTILKRLKDKQLVDSNRQGHCLTSAGLAYVSEKFRLFTPPFEIRFPGFSGVQAMVAVHQPSIKLASPVDLRDLAIKAGADAAIILVKSGKGYVFPGSDDELGEYARLGEVVSDMGSDGDPVILIASGKTRHRAEVGVLTMALELTQ